MIYLDKFLHFISADGHHYKVPSSEFTLSPNPPLMVEGRPFETYVPASANSASKPLPLAYLSPRFGIPSVYNLYNLDNVARRWLGRIHISDNQGSVSVKSVTDSGFAHTDAGDADVDYLYFGYKVYIEFYDANFQLKTISDWIEWAYRSQNELTHELRTVDVTLEGVAQYVKIRYSCFQSSDVTDSGPHVDYVSGYIYIYPGSQSIDSSSSAVSDNRIHFIFSEQIS